MDADMPLEEPQASMTMTRRGLLVGLSALPLATMAPSARALTLAEARGLIHLVVGKITTIINSGKSESAMIADFERIFAAHADVPTIARSALGPPARTASAAQIRAFTEAFRGYMARKYGKQFGKFLGGSVSVTDARRLQAFYEVDSVVKLRDSGPFEVRWHVSDRSGENRFFNMIIDGVNVLASERVEIAAMLERRGGDLDRLISDLRRAG